MNQMVPSGGYQAPQEQFFPLALLSQQGQDVKPFSYEYIEAPEKVQEILVPKSKPQVESSQETFKTLSLQEAEKLFFDVKETINGKCCDVLLLGKILDDLLSEAEFSNSFFVKFDYYRREVNRLFDSRFLILFSQLEHIFQWRNYNDDEFEIIKNEKGVQKNFSDRIEKVIRYKNLIINFKNGIEIDNDINSISELIKNRGEESGVKVETVFSGEKNPQGKINQFFINIILDNILSNYCRYGTNGTLKVVFYENIFDIIMINDKKELEFGLGTGKGIGIMSSCAKEIFSGNIATDYEGDTCTTKITDLKYS